MQRWSWSTLLAANRQSIRSMSGGRGGGYRGGGGRGRGGRGRGGGGGRFGNRGPPRPLDLSRDRIEELTTPSGETISIAIEGCCHGQLEAIYTRLEQFEKDNNGRKIDLLLCCGDFQSLRTPTDFHSASIPPKYRDLGSFHRYYSGERTAPMLTLFIGGNHEASQPLSELYYGGWVAPNIYYLGAAGVVQYRGLRIGGISGIYAHHDYHQGHYEVPPYQGRSLKSIYHVRDVEVFRAKSLAPNQLDIFVSHDWPLGIEQHGDTDQLLLRKPFFRKEIQANDLGSPPNREILDAIQPKWWFSAHLHVKFAATVQHTKQTSSATSLVPSQVKTTQFRGVDASCTTTNDLTTQMTRFLSLDKCLPRRDYLSILNVQPTEESAAGLQYDPEWLAILRRTAHLTSTNSVAIPLQLAHVSDEEVDWVRQNVPLSIPNNFVQTVPPHDGTQKLPNPLPPPYPRMGNPQTDALLQMLEIPHALTIPSVPWTENSHVSVTVADDNEIDLDELEEADENEIDIDDDAVDDAGADPKRARTEDS